MMAEAEGEYVNCILSVIIVADSSRGGVRISSVSRFNSAYVKGR